MSLFFATAIVMFVFAAPHSAHATDASFETVSGVGGQGMVHAIDVAVNPGEPTVYPPSCVHAAGGQTVWETVSAPADSAAISYSSVSVDGGQMATITATLSSGYIWGSLAAGWVVSGTNTVTWSYQLQSVVCPESAPPPAVVYTQDDEGSGNDGVDSDSGDVDPSTGGSDSAGVDTSGSDVGSADPSTSEAESPQVNESRAEDAGADDAGSSVHSPQASSPDVSSPNANSPNASSPGESGAHTSGTPEAGVADRGLSGATANDAASDNNHEDTGDDAADGGEGSDDAQADTDQPDGANSDSGESGSAYSSADDPEASGEVRPENDWTADSDSEAVPPQAERDPSPYLVTTGVTLPYVLITVGSALVLTGLAVVITVRRREA
ncbi:hypothetical protein [Gulosibacter chungangensis]|uniref:Uncharacterized protein n=1 Tax=Gulosibacter chungangensis TaxID=979746 RepID=A0A7J5B753_9MICO|nr:hypothetical protein [Gulosibacter chungangensis]KAB1640558.1 hypothetical protein F8O05_14420 [Gulosibacter chungangensis]